MNRLKNIDPECRKRICIIISLLIAVITTAVVMQRQMVHVDQKLTETQQELAKEVLRFHVLANSNSREDQSLKMKVKEEVIDFIKENIPEARNAEEVKAWALDHKKEIEKISEDIARREGKDYSVKAMVSMGYFPDKTYGDVTFPAGMYEALRIKIGEARGRNWWCVLYPSLCFVDASHAVVPEEGKEKLQSVLSEDEYEMVTAASKFKIKWYFLGK